MMRISGMKLALLSSVAAMAFENSPGWKKDADGKLVLDGDGNPIYVTAAGNEQSVKHDTIANLNAEAKQHREAAGTAIAKLKTFEKDGKLIDPTEAIKAIDLIGKIDAKKLIDAGEVDKVRDQIKSEFTTQLAERDKALETTKGELSNLRIAKVFDGSEFVRERVAVPRDMFEATFRGRFKDEDGKVVAYGPDGNRLLSKKNAGEYATPDEALELLVEMHPQKDAIVKAVQTGGSGNQGGGGGRGQGRTIKRADFDKMTPGEQGALGAQMAKGEIAVVD